MSHAFTYKTDRPWPNPRMREGAIVGHTTATTAKLWLRTGALGAFELLYYPTDMPGAQAFHARLRQVPFDASALPPGVERLPFTIPDFSTDTTIVLQLAGLQPFTSYSYAFYGRDRAGNHRVLLGHDGDRLAYSLRTLSADPKAPITFGLFSCHMPYTKPRLRAVRVRGMELWDAFNATLQRHRKDGELGFVIGGGDQVYADEVDGLNIWDYLRSRLEKAPSELPSEDDMVSWYRDIYRGYWGFSEVKSALSQAPTYMIWDDHELGDGWGSFVFKGGNVKGDELERIFPDWHKKGLNYDHCRAAIDAMGRAAKRVYREYQHSHNPDTADNCYDYHFEANSVAVYALDGRGHRDINRDSHRILGQAQLARFGAWLAGLDPAKTPWVFVVSAVPLMHLRAAIVNETGRIAGAADLEDDLRDAWEHKLHDTERRELIKLLFDAAARGLKVSILSGDVHMSAAFRLTDPAGRTIYQLTSSAITYPTSRAVSWALRIGVLDKGSSPDGYTFKRLAFVSQNNYAMLTVDPAAGEAYFQLYGAQTLDDPNDPNNQLPITHSMFKIELDF